MAIFHLTTKIISRSKGQNAVAAAAYRSGEKIKDPEGKNHDYTRKGGVVHTEIIAPENAPDWVKNRGELWRTVEAMEKRKDAQLAREVEVALPSELSREQQIKLVRNYAREVFVCEGMIADVAIHDKGDDNPHAHIMLTLRRVDGEVFGGKERSWNDKNLVNKWREGWEITTNAALERAGREERIDRRTLEAQGVD